MKCSLTVCSLTEGKAKEGNFGVGHSWYMGKTSSLSGNRQRKSKKMEVEMRLSGGTKWNVLWPYVRQPKGKKKERNAGVGHNLIYGKDIVFAWEYQGKRRRRRKEEEGNRTKTRMQPRARGPFHLVEECGWEWMKKDLSRFYFLSRLNIELSISSSTLISRRY